MQFCGIKNHGQRVVHFDGDVRSDAGDQVKALVFKMDNDFVTHRFNNADVGGKSGVVPFRRRMNVFRPYTQNHIFIRPGLQDAESIARKRQGKIAAPELKAVRAGDGSADKIHRRASDKSSDKLVYRSIIKV